MRFYPRFSHPLPALFIQHSTLEPSAAFQPDYEFLLLGLNVKFVDGVVRVLYRYRK